MSGLSSLKRIDKRQLFRLFVDGRFQKATQYNGWLGYEHKEPGSVKAILSAYEKIFEYYDDASALTVEYILTLHRAAMSGVLFPAQDSFCPGDVRFRANRLPLFKKTTTIESIAEILSYYEPNTVGVFHHPDLMSMAVCNLTAERVFEALQRVDRLYVTSWMPTLDREARQALSHQKKVADFYEAKRYVQQHILMKLQSYLDDYNYKIKLADHPDTKLRLIASLIRNLEILHPFSDGNCRVFANVLLTHLLMYHGFAPAMLWNPNLDFEHSLDQWISDIEDGMRNTLELIHNPTYPLFDYCIEDADEKTIASFCDMASPLIEKIAQFQPLFLDSVHALTATKGKWINLSQPIVFQNISSHGAFRAGDLYFASAIHDWEKQGVDVAEALKKCQDKGVKAIVIDSLTYVLDLKIPILLVNDTEQAFEDCASYVRQVLNPKLVLITGTEGKTGSKIQLHHVLKELVSTHAVLNSANTGVPIYKSLISLDPDCRIELNEFSVDANEEKTIRRAKVLNPDICFFSNISTEHMHVHGSLSGVLSHKSAVIEGLRAHGFVVLNGSMPTYPAFRAALLSRRSDINIVTFGLDQEHDAWLVSQHLNNQTQQWLIEAVVQGERVRYTLPMIQSHAPLMSVGLLLTVSLLGQSVSLAAAAFNNVEPFESMGMLRSVNLSEGAYTLYDQSRRSSIAGVRSVFHDIKNIHVVGKKILVLGSVSSVKDNEWAKLYHEELADLVDQSDVRYLLTTGPNMQYLHHHLKHKDKLVLHTDDYDLLYYSVMQLIGAGDLLIVQGYQRLYLDKLVNRFIAPDQYVDDNKRMLDDISKMSNDVFTDEDVALYKTLCILRDSDNKLPMALLEHRYTLSVDAINQIKSVYHSFPYVAGDVLLQFFKHIDSWLQEQYGYCRVNERLLSSERYIVTQAFCRDWFDRNETGKPAKQLFGSFFDLGRNDFVLFFMVGTTNLHVGLAGVVSVGNQLQLGAGLDTGYLEQINQDLSQSYHLVPRKWGVGWATIDLGSVNDLLSLKTFQVMCSFEKSELFVQAICPLLMRLKQGNF